MARVERGFDTLPPGTAVDAYEIRKVLGAGGFGVTYLAEHRRLGKDFAIKEFFPRAFAYRDAATVHARTGGEETYAWGLDRFLQEARALAKFHHHAIVGVSNVFEANGTAYMVLSFEHGQDMRDWLAGLKRPPTQGELDSITLPLLDALALLHESGLLHRDIAPDNIFIRRDGTPVLLDFGAARSALSQHSAQMSAIVKTGYSPPEQYSTQGRAQGPWSDIYAFGATLYWAVTGGLPPESTDRTLKDTYVAAGRKARGTFRPGFLAAIDEALRVSPDARPRSIAEWRRLLESSLPAAPSTAAITAPQREEANPPATAAVAAPASPAATFTPESTRYDAPIDLGPGTVKPKRTWPPRLGRGPAGLVVGLALLLALVIGIVVYLQPPRTAAFSSAGGDATTAATSVAACDRLASMPYDGGARSATLPIEKVDAAAAVKACTAAVSAATAADAPRLRTQLAYALTAAGKPAEAAQALTAASATGYPHAMAMYAEWLIDGFHPIAYTPAEGCKLADQAARADSAHGKTVLGNCVLSGIGGYTRDPERTATLFREASAAGHAIAKISLGMMLRDGVTGFDGAQARKLFEEADRLGEPRGTYLLAGLFENGVLVAGDGARADELYQRARAGLEKCAAANDIDCLRLLGLMRFQGEGGAKDQAPGLKNLEAAANRGSTTAMSNLGSILANGDAALRDYPSALKWLRAAAARDSDGALNILGTLYWEGRGVAPDYAESMQLYQRAAALGHADATYNIGELHYYGRGVPENFATALSWYRKAADLGSSAAIYSIGSMYQSGRGVKENIAEARRWYERAAARGDGNGMNSLGEMSLSGKGGRRDPAEAEKWFRKAGDAKNGAALFNLGEMYRTGDGVAEDQKRALEFYRRSAELQEARGEHQLGKAYLMGRGTAIDYAEAYKWIKAAADQKLPAAISDVGFMHLRGYGVAEDAAEAFRRFKEAAELGDPTGMNNVANSFELGRGVAKNCAQARIWYGKAVEAGHEDAKKPLADLNKTKC